MECQEPWGPLEGAHELAEISFNATTNLYGGKECRYKVAGEREIPFLKITQVAGEILREVPFLKITQVAGEILREIPLLKIMQVAGEILREIPFLKITPEQK